MRRSYDQYFDFEPYSPTDKQQAFLNRHNLNPDYPLDFYSASNRIGQFVRDRRQLSPTARQEKLLKDLGKWREGMSRGEAFDLIRQFYAGGNGPA